MPSPDLEPRTISPMHWSCLREIGIEYSLPLSDPLQERLHYPVYAERASDGATLIVDELGKERGVPTRMECRTLLVGRDCRIFYDSTEHGISDGYGCIVDENSIALLRRTRWELSFVSRSGEEFKTISLSHFSKKLPRHVVRTHRQTFLILFLDRSGQLDIVELDREGRLLWYLPDNAVKLGVPGTLELLPNDNLLLADEFYHVALEIKRDGTIAQSWGESRHPSDGFHHLSSPKSIRSGANGNRVIADTRNHRILTVSPNDVAARLACPTINWSSPTFAQQLENGHFLVCDSGNGCVVQVDSADSIVWRFGGERARRYLSFPRSVELELDGSYLIADTAHNRLVSIKDDVCSTLPAESGVVLFWPRCARRLADGSVLIADGRNARVVELSAQGQVTKTLDKLDYVGGVSFSDPHDVRLLENGNLLIADAANDLVVETDWRGHVVWGVGAPGDKTLSDPHTAQKLDDGTVLIADTGHHRLIVVDRSGQIIKEIKELTCGPFHFRLNRLRYAEVSSDGVLVVSDTGNNRVLAAEWGGELIWEINTISGSPLPFLDQPRWAQLTSRDEVIISDHYNQRIVHLRRETQR